MNLPGLPSLLRSNAAYSMVTGGLAVVAHEAAARSLAVPGGLLIAVGVVLIAFGVAVAWVSAGTRATATAGLVVAGADTLWVVLMSMFVSVPPPPTSGIALVVVTTAPVAAFAVLQALAAMRLADPGLRTVEVHRTIEGTPDATWTVMTDHDLYARLAPNLSRVGPFTPTQGTARTGRTCWDIRGRHWDETLTSWEPGRTFSVEVDTRAESYPYPLEEMRGTWSVTAAGPGRSLVTMRFEVRPRRGATGRAFASALAGAGPAMMRKIITGWESEVMARNESPLAS
jgi:hypothetical protein